MTLHRARLDYVPYNYYVKSVVLHCLAISVMCTRDAGGGGGGGIVLSVAIGVVRTKV